MKFTLNKAVVRHAGEIGHTIRRDNITEFEIRILKRLHGSDAVVDIVQTGEVERTENDEHKRLARFYGLATVEKVFNVVLDDYSDWIGKTLDEEHEARDAAQAARDEAAQKATHTLTVKR